MVITGIGPVSSIGNGVKDFWEGLLAGKTNIREIPAEFEKQYHYRSRFFVPFPDLESLRELFPAKYGSMMEKPSLAAYLATRLAMADAGLEGASQDPLSSVDFADGTIILGTGICPLRPGFEAFAAHAVEGWEKRFNRLVIPMTMTDAPAAWLSILFGITGPSFTVNASCASGTLAIGEAFRALQEGKAAMAITGGVECLEDPSGTIMRGFDCLGTLTDSRDGLPSTFSEDRSGFLFSEGGACVLILETLGRALARGVVPYAEILDYRCNSDAHNIVQMDPEAPQLKKLIGGWLKEEKIGYLNAHGTGTRLNDETEAMLIKSFFKHKDDQPYVNSTKGILGHSIGASGAYEAAATALSIRTSLLHPNLAENPFEDLNIVKEKTEISIEKAITVSYGFGGHKAGLLLGKVKE